MTNETYQFSDDKENLNFRDIIDGYIRYWHWFIGSALVALLIAFIYLKLTIPTYWAVSSIIIEGEEGKTASSDTGGFVDLNLLGGLRTSSIENELGLLRSKRLMTNAVKALNLNVQYFERGGILDEEIYKRTPYSLRLIRMDESKLKLAMAEGENEFDVNPVANNRIAIEFAGSEKQVEANLGDVIELEYADFVIQENNVDSLTLQEGKQEGVMIKFLPVESVASIHRSGLEVSLVDENSTLIQVSMVDAVRKKAEDILDQLIFEYNQEAIEDKNLIARNTAFFIDERLNIINSELDSVETGKEQFKEANRLTDIQAESSMIIQNASEYNNRQQEVDTELELTNAMIEHINSNDTGLLPTNLGIKESGAAQLIDEFNKLVLERNRLLKGATERNPMVVSLDDQIQEIKSNILGSLQRRRSNLLIARDNLRRQAGILGSQISEVPSQERQFRGIERQQNIKEALYLFLLQKREENSLSLAAKAPKAKLVDKAYSSGIPVSPNSKIVFAVALLSGLFLPFLVINVKTILNNKVLGRDDIKTLGPGIPLLGEIPHIASKGHSIVSKNERSMLAESFSILCANITHLDFNPKPGDDQGICIYITSSIKGEGKTFAAINIAMTLAMGGKKVLVIGADLRNPQIHRYENNLYKSKGLSDYLADSQPAAVQTLIKESSLHTNLKILNSGTIPSNPTELLRTDKMGQMLTELKERFDYIIVDTAPAMLLADTFLISKHADLTLYLIRAGYTKKKLLEFASDSWEEGKLKRLAFILNDVHLANTAYGNTYGYKYGD